MTSIADVVAPSFGPRKGGVSMKRLVIALALPLLLTVGTVRAADRHMVGGLGGDSVVSPGELKVIGMPTVREKDGLALSSRNVYLSELERMHAPVLYRALKTCAERIKAGEPIEMVLEEGRQDIARAEFALDYLEARHALTLAPIASLKNGPIRLLVAAKIGKTRLIDNLGV